MTLSTAFLNAQNDGWHITTEEKTDYTGIAISNGRIGILTSEKPLEVKHVVLNNVYDVDPYLKVSQIVHGMNFGNIDMYIDGEKISEENGKKSGIRFYGNKGKMRAIIRIQACARGKITFDKCKKIKMMVIKVRKIQAAFRNYLFFLKIKEETKKKSLQKLK